MIQGFTRLMRMFCDLTSALWVVADAVPGGLCVLAHFCILYVYIYIWGGVGRGGVEWGGVGY